MNLPKQARPFKKQYFSSWKGEGVFFALNFVLAVHWSGFRTYQFHFYICLIFCSDMSSPDLVTRLHCSQLHFYLCVILVFGTLEIWLGFLLVFWNIPRHFKSQYVQILFGLLPVLYFLVIKTEFLVLREVLWQCAFRKEGWIWVYSHCTLISADFWIKYQKVCWCLRKKRHCIAKKP